MREKAKLTLGLWPVQPAARKEGVLSAEGFGAEEQVSVGDRSYFMWPVIFYWAFRICLICKHYKFHCDERPYV